MVESDLFKVRYGDATYLIILSDGSNKIAGDFEFDGQMLCARFDTAGRLAKCFGPKPRASFIAAACFLMPSSVYKTDSAIVPKQ
jgi:hypothetical protein